MEQGLSLRERKKKKVHNLILNVSGELFDLHGYDKTSMSEIANAAEVSPATVFNYFGTKDNILVSIMKPVLVRAYDSADIMLEQPGDVPVSVIMAILDHVSAITTISKPVSRIVNLQRAGSSKEIIELILWSDNRVKGLFHKYLSYLRANKKLNTELNIQRMVELLFSISVARYRRWLIDDKQLSNNIFNGMDEDVNLLFSSWFV